MSLKNVKDFFLGVLLGTFVILVGILLGNFAFEISNNQQFTRSTLISSVVNKIPKAYVVQSGSMEPAIKTASLVITLPQSAYNQNDIITFRKNGNAKQIITHRINFKLYPEGIDNPVYKTSGDANEDFDAFSVTNDQIIGRAAISIPYLGYIVDFAKRPQGFILLVIVPATIIIYEELKYLLREAKKKLVKSKNNTSSTTLRRTMSEKREKRSFLLRNLSILIPSAGAFFVVVGISASYFFDTEISQNNLIQVYTDEITPSPSASPTPTPTPGVAEWLVINEVLAESSCSVGQTEAQWLELYNGYPFEVNPKNFKITDGTTTIDLVTANNLTIPSGGLLLLSHNAAIWNPQSGCWSDNGTQTGNLGGQLNIDTGQLKLIDTDGTTTLDTVIWGDEPLDPTIDESIGRNPHGWDTAFGDAFNASDFAVYATPSSGLSNPGP